MKILTGISGGVDSIVSALLLKQQGHDVTGVMMTIWGKDGIYEKIKQNKQKAKKGACLDAFEEEDVELAQKMCEQIGIDFHCFDCSKEYQKIVLSNFKKEYLSGKTPNPCVWCNSLVKFGVLPLFAKECGLEFDKFATGHYANVEYENGRYLLKRAMDDKKDQTYFLYRLSQEQLSKAIFPLGNYTKDEIRNIAIKNGLEAAYKKDSQDFYDGDYGELLDIKPKKGNIINEKGEILGKHEGIWNFTIGQRRGLKISVKEPLYVIDLKSATNEVVVGTKQNFKDNLTLSSLNWIAFDSLDKEIKCKAKIRSSSKMENAVVVPIAKDSVYVEFENMQKSITPSQSVVFYKDDVVLGGGIIN